MGAIHWIRNADFKGRLAVKESFNKWELRFNSLELIVSQSSLKFTIILGLFRTPYCILQKFFLLKGKYNSHSC